MARAMARRIGLVVACVVGLAAQGQAASLLKALADEPAATTPITQVKANPYAHYVMEPVDKLTRGVINLMTGSLEVPRTIGKRVQARGWVRGLPAGVADGLKRTVIRTVGGVWDVVTFPAPPYHRLLLRPEFAAGESSLYRGLPEEIIWQAIESPGPPLPDGPLAVPVTVLTAPLHLPDETDRSQGASR